REQPPETSVLAKQTRNCAARTHPLYKGMSEHKAIQRHVRAQSDFEMGTRRRRVFVSKISARSHLELRRRPYDDRNGGPGLSRQSRQCRSRGGFRRFALELSSAYVSGNCVQAEVRARLV